MVVEQPVRSRRCQAEKCRRLATAHIYQDSRAFWVCDVHLKSVMRGLKLALAWKL